MKRITMYLAAALIVLCFSSCSAEEKKDPNIWITLEDINTGNPIDGYYVHCKALGGNRYDLMISTEQLKFNDGRLINGDAVIVPDSIEVYLEPNHWVELNYRKDTRSGISFIRGNLDGLIGKCPVQIEFYDRDNNRRSIYLISDSSMRKRFFPHY